MPICDIWRYMFQDSHNKLEACRVLMGKVESSDVYFLATYILSSFFLTIFLHFYSVFISMAAHHVLQQRWNQSLFLPIYSTYSLFLPIRVVSNSTSLCISIFWGGKTFFEAWRFLETRENLDSSLKWTLDKCKRFKTIRVCLSFFFQT